MAIREPFDFISNLPDNQKLISVADPIGSAAGATTYYLVRRFSFEEGDYVFEAHADDAASIWLGITQLDIRMLTSGRLEDGAFQAYVHIAKGDYRLDVFLENLPAGENPCYFDLVIKKDGVVVYASTKEGWLLDESPISDEDLPPPDDYRFKLPVFSVLPNWDNGILERLNWITDVLPSERDAEQRRSVRRNARRSFEANFLRQNEKRNRLDTFFVGVGASQFMMPLWHEAVKLLDGLDMEAAGVFFEDGELYAREFRTGDLVFVNSGNPDDYDILQVGLMEENRFSWAFPPPRSWPRGTRIYPMRTAILTGPAARMSNITDTVSTAVVRFDMVEPYSVPASWGGSLDGQPLFRFIPDRSQQMDVEYNRRYYTLDNNSGVPVTTDHGRYTFTQVQMRMLMTSRSEAYRFRQFLQAARGQAKHFYMSTFMQDVTPLGGIPADTPYLLIRPQGFVDAMRSPQPIRFQLAFQFRRGVQTLYRTIETVQEIYKTDPDGSPHTPPIVIAELITLNEPLPAIELRELRRISFVCETRFAQDGFELLHSTNQQRAVSTALVFRQATNPRTVP